MPNSSETTLWPIQSKGTGTITLDNVQTGCHEHYLNIFLNIWVRTLLLVKLCSLNLLKWRGVIPYAVNIYICIFLYIFKVLNMFFKEYSKLVFVTLKKIQKGLWPFIFARQRLEHFQLIFMLVANFEDRKLITDLYFLSIMTLSQ